MDIRKKAGFTLIELLVVIGIVGTMIAMSAVMLTSVKKQRQVQVAAEQVKNIIIEAHAYAVAPQDKGEGEKINVILSDAFGGPGGSRISQYAIVRQSGGTGAQNLIDRGFSTNIRLFCEGAANPCVSFNAKDPNKIGQVVDNHTIIVRNEANTEIYTLTVDPITGNVTMVKS